MRRLLLVLAGLILTGIVSSFSFAASPQLATTETELKGAFRRPENNGWTLVNLHGTPYEIGFQNGYLLAPEIEDTLNIEQEYRANI